MNKIYAIKDNKIGFTNAPFTAPNHVAAIRMFADLATDLNSYIYKHPEDYELYALGEMDEETGEIKSKIQFLERAISYKNEK